MPGFYEFAPADTILQECVDEKEGMQSLVKFQKVIQEFVASPEHFGCSLPCERTLFTYDVIDNHYNSVMLQSDETRAEKDEDGYVVFYFYKTFLVEQRVETLIYDFGGFIAAAGGNLGLCLGFSLLSILLSLTQLLTPGFQRLKLKLSNK